MFEKLAFWATSLLVSFPWIIVTIICLGGGKLEFSSEGMFKQLGKLFGKDK